MSQWQELEDQIKELSPSQLQELRAWFAQYEAEVWDRQLQDDALAGRLDAIADPALKEFFD